MGEAISGRQYLRCTQASYVRPLVFCCGLDGITDGAVSMNVAIAKHLAGIAPAMRSIRLEQCLTDVLRGLPENVVIRDIDVLFNPDYQVDVLDLLVSAYRKHAFALLWPGKLKGSRLVYAEEGCPDYRPFPIEHYDITCIY